MKQLIIGLSIFFLLLIGCEDNALNNPYSEQEQSQNVFYSSFSERPKTLDPARSYSALEARFTAQIYEPPFQYHYLNRPYQLIAQTATEASEPVYWNRSWQQVDKEKNPDQIAYTTYDISIKPGIYYQPHPALAKNEQGEFYYHNLTAAEIAKKDTLADFPETGTRELIAEDYVYQIIRLASPAVQSPILSFQRKYILGLSDLAERLTQHWKNNKQLAKPAFFDLRNYSFPGAKVLDRYRYRITLQGEYPQFRYWLAMPFFSPIPWEADKFYSQKGMKNNNISFDWYPIGTGPYMLIENNPNRRIVLVKNPNFHGDNYPTSGEYVDIETGLLKNAGKPLPFIDKFIFQLELESIPRWNKFLQGYYDSSAISSDNFDQTIQFDSDGKKGLTGDLAKKGMRLNASVDPGIFYIGFNMLDSSVGGNSVRARKLRQAIAIAIDFEEYLSIFQNGRGVIAQGPLPPAIFGYQAGKKGMNPYVYNWQGSGVKRKSLSEAKRLLTEAGYHNGVDQHTGQPLVLNFDTTGGGDAGARNQFNWLRKQFAKLGIQLHIRATQYNRFQDKLRTGNAQIFMFGWLADYPDPENFLFLLYGPNGKVKYGGENSTNYTNQQYDDLFTQMKNLPNGDKRQAVIDKMLAIVRRDVPMVWGYHQQVYQLSHIWSEPKKPSQIVNNDLKYLQIDSVLRKQKRAEWNRPVLWPIIIILIVLLIGLIPIVIRYYQKTHTKPRLEQDIAKRENE